MTRQAAPPLQLGFGLDELRAAIAAGRLFLFVSEFADLTRTDERTTRRAIENGQVRAVRFGNTVRIPTVELLRLAELEETPEDSGAGAGTPASANDDLATTRKIYRPVDNELNGYSDGTESGV